MSSGTLHAGGMLGTSSAVGASNGALLRCGAWPHADPWGLLAVQAVQETMEVDGLLLHDVPDLMHNACRKTWSSCPEQQLACRLHWLQHRLGAADAPHHLGN